MRSGPDFAYESECLVLSKDPGCSTPVETNLGSSDFIIHDNPTFQSNDNPTIQSINIDINSDMPVSNTTSRRTSDSFGRFDQTCYSYNVTQANLHRLSSPFLPCLQWFNPFYRECIVFVFSYSACF